VFLTERTAPLVFEKELSQSKLEVRCLTAEEVSQYQLGATQRSFATSLQQSVAASLTEEGTTAQEHIRVGDQHAAQRLQIVDIDLKKLRPLIRVCYIPRCNMKKY